MDKWHTKKVSELLEIYLGEVGQGTEDELGIVSDIFAQLEQRKDSPTSEEFADFLDENLDGEKTHDAAIQLAVLDAIENRLVAARRILMDQLK